MTEDKRQGLLVDIRTSNSNQFRKLIEYTKINYSPVFYAVFLLIGFSKCIFENIVGVFFEQVFYATMVIVWWLIIERRLLNKKMKYLIRHLALGMVFLLLFELSRYDFFYVYPTLSRFAWYAYYIPYTFFPPLFFFIIYHSNRNEYDYTDKRLHFLYVPSILLLIMVLTNDLHQMVFKFDKNYPIEDEVFSYNIGYFLVVLWFVGFTIYNVYYMIRKTKKRNAWKKLLLPALPMTVGTIICIFITFGINPVFLGRKMYNICEAEIFTAIAVIECLISVGLIPSNRQYKRFFINSTLLAQIENEDGEVEFSSVSADKLEQQVSEGYASQEDYKLRMMDIPGGRVYWVDDHSEINKLNREIEQITDTLNEGNELRKQENKIQEDNARFETLNRLYDEISKETSAQIERVREVLSSDDREETFRERLSLAAIYNVYIKRQSNLILLGQENGSVELKELFLAIKETVEFLNYYGINAGVNVGKLGSISAFAAVEAYRLIQEVIDNMIPDARACFIFMETSSKTIKIRMMIDGATKLPTEKEHLKVEGDTQSAIITISFNRKEVENE